MDFESFNLQRIVDNANAVQDAREINSNNRRFVYKKNSKKEKKPDHQEQGNEVAPEAELYDQGEKKKTVGEEKRTIDFKV